MIAVKKDGSILASPSSDENDKAIPLT